MFTLISPRWRSCLLLAACLAFLPIAQDRPAAVSDDVVISQVYGGGGNSGAPYKNDFVELYNRGSVSVSLAGKSIQYASATGTGYFGANSGQMVVLAGTIEPGGYYLIQLGGGSNGIALPTPQATGTIAMGASAGKVALVDSPTGLGCNGGKTPCSDAQKALIIDLVGWGNADFYEGSGPAPGTSNTTAAIRAEGGAIDTDNNATDFAAGTPTPRSSTIPPSGVAAASPVSVAEGETTLLTVTVTPGDKPVSTGLGASIDLLPIGGLAAQPLYDDGTNGDITASDNVFSYSATVAIGTTAGFKTLKATITDAQARVATASVRLAVGADPLAIHDIQGAGSTSPYAGQFVSTTGIVTGVKTLGSKGFFIQAPAAEADADPLTSEGLFVYTGGVPPADAAIGNLVQVVGPVQEYASGNFAVSLTEIGGSPLVALLSSGHTAPAPVRLGARDLNPGRPAGWMERYEGMRVRATLRAVAPTGGYVTEASATAASNGLFVGVLPFVPRPFREPGLDVTENWPADAPAHVPQFDGNPERLAVNSMPLATSAPIDVSTGAFVTNLVGPLDFASGVYTIVLDGSAVPDVVSDGRTEAVPVPAPRYNQFTVAGFNVERFFDTENDPDTSDPVLTAEAFAARLNKASLAIRNVLRSPDILGVAEVENLATLQALAAKVNADAVAAGKANPNYAAYLEEGNDPGGIDVGFLVKLGNATRPRLAVVDVTQLGKGTTYVPPGAVEPALLNDRPPLALRVTVNDPRSRRTFPLTVIVNHLRSLNDIADAEDGPRVRAKRLGQAEFLAAEVQARQAAGEHVVLVGDFNAFQFNDGYADVMGAITGRPAKADEVVLAGEDLVQPNLVNLVQRVPPYERYSYLMSGNAQVLDHVLVTSSLVPHVRMVYARSDADFPETYRNDATRPERLSDHDAPVAYFTFPPARWSGPWGKPTQGHAAHK